MYLRRSRLTALALGAALVAGCSHMGSNPPGQTVILGDTSGSARVTAQQAANVEVALGRTLENKGANEQAMAAYKEAIQRDPHCADAYIHLGILYDLQGKGEESAKCYHKALKERPGDADIFCNMGYSYYLQQRWAESEMNLRQAVALKPEHRRAHMNLGLVLARTERVPEALVEFRTAKCSVADANVNVAFALTLDGKLRDARGYYERAIAADPGSEAAKNGLSELQTLMAKAQKPRPRTSTAPIVTASYQAPAEPRGEKASVGFDDETGP